MMKHSIFLIAGKVPRCISFFLASNLNKHRASKFILKTEEALGTLQEPSPPNRCDTQILSNLTGYLRLFVTSLNEMLQTPKKKGNAPIKTLKQAQVCKIIPENNLNHLNHLTQLHITDLVGCPQERCAKKGVLWISYSKLSR